MRKSLAVLVLGLGLATALAVSAADKGDQKVDTRVFELRTYTAAPGKMEALHARFRDHTCKLFKKHNMTIIGFWSPIDAQQAKSQLIYLLAFPSKDAAAKGWKDFQADPEWKAVKEASEKNGKLVEKIDSVYLKPTDYSAMK